jgi:hypothetical protein
MRRTLPEEVCVEINRKTNAVLFIDVSRPFSYLTGLLNRMVIKASAVSPFIRDVNENHGAWERRMSPLCN